MHKKDELIEQKKFCVEICEQEKISFPDALLQLPATAKKGKKYFWSCLSQLSNGFELFYVKNTGTGEFEYEEANAFANPESYQIVFEHTDEAEYGFAGTTEWTLDPSHNIIMGENLKAVGMQSLNSVHVIGDTYQSPRRNEQLMQFAQLLATRFIQERYDDIKKKIYTHDGLQPQAFIDAYVENNERAGSYETFKVQCASIIYSREGGEKVAFDEMKLPEGVGRELRRGTISIYFNSLLSPNGVAQLYDELQLDIIADQKGLFKVCTYRWVLN